MASSSLSCHSTDCIQTLCQRCCTTPASDSTDALSSSTVPPCGSTTVWIPSPPSAADDWAAVLSQAQSLSTAETIFDRDSMSLCTACNACLQAIKYKFNWQTFIGWPRFMAKKIKDFSRTVKCLFMAHSCNTLLCCVIRFWHHLEKIFTSWTGRCWTTEIQHLLTSNSNTFKTQFDFD